MKKILLTRLGGAGDTIMTEPVLRAIHAKYAPCHITYRSHRHYYDLLLYHPLIDEILVTRTGCWKPTPDGYDIHINLHGVIEKAPFGTHGIDAFAAAAGVKVNSKIPKLYLSGTERPVTSEDDRYLEVQHPIINPTTIAESDITLHMPHAPRNFIWSHHIIRGFLKYFGDHGEHPNVKIVGTAPIEAGRSSLLRMANMINKSKMFVGPDSGGFHMAIALNVPTIVSLTDKFPCSMRGYPKATVVGDNDPEELFSTSLALYRSIKYA